MSDILERLSSNQRMFDLGKREGRREVIEQLRSLLEIDERIKAAIEHHESFYQHEVSDE